LENFKAAKLIWSAVDKRTIIGV